MNSRRLQIEVLRSAVAVYRIRDLILARFERSPDRGDTVRASDLDHLVAASLDVTVNNALRIKVRQAMRLAGWRAVRPGNVPTYRHCRAKAFVDHGDRLKPLLGHEYDAKETAQLAASAFGRLIRKKAK